MYMQFLEFQSQFPKIYFFLKQIKCFKIATTKYWKTEEYSMKEFTTEFYWLWNCRPELELVYFFHWMVIDQSHQFPDTDNWVEHFIPASTLRASGARQQGFFVFCTFVEILPDKVLLRLRSLCCCILRDIAERDNPWAPDGAKVSIHWDFKSK